MFSAWWVHVDEKACPTSIPQKNNLCSQNARAARSLDLLLSLLAEQLSLDRNGLHGQLALAKHLEVTELRNIDQGHSAICLLGVLLALLETHHGPQLVQVDGRAVVGVLLVVEVPHTNFTEVARVVLVEGNPVHVLTSRITTTARVLAVLANTAVTAVHSSALLPVLLLSGRLPTLVR